MAGAERISDEVRSRRWCWIGHVLRKEANSDCAVALGWKPEGREADADPKLPDVALQRRRETDKDGEHGQERGRQQTTATSGGKMFGLCVPPGTRRINLIEKLPASRQFSSQIAASFPARSSRTTNQIFNFYLILFTTETFPTSFPGSLFSASIVVNATHSLP